MKNGICAGTIHRALDAKRKIALGGMRYMPTDILQIGDIRNLLADILKIFKRNRVGCEDIIAETHEELQLYRFTR